LLLLVELLSVVNVNVKIHIDIVKVIVWNLRAARWRLRIARDFLFDGFVLLLPGRLPLPLGGRVWMAVGLQVEDVVL